MVSLMPKPQAPKKTPRKISVKEIGKPTKIANSIAMIIHTPMTDRLAGRRPGHRSGLRRSHHSGHFPRVAAYHALQISEMPCIVSSITPMASDIFTGQT